MINNSKSFLQFFQQPREQRIVLFIDDFDTLASRPLHLRTFFNTLTRIINKPLNFGLQAVVTIGSCNLTSYCTSKKPPFDIAINWKIPSFTLEEVRKIFEEFKRVHGVELEDGCVDHIFEITQGHKGMVSFCGKKIYERFLRESKRVSLKQWKGYAQDVLPK